MVIIKKIAFENSVITVKMSTLPADKTAVANKESLKPIRVG